MSNKKPSSWSNGPNAPPILDRAKCGNVKTQGSLDKKTSDPYGESKSRGPDKKTKIEEQHELEQQMIDKGHTRFEDRQGKLKGSQQDAAQFQIEEALGKVSQVITKYLSEEKARFSSGQGKKSLWYEELKDQDPDTLAYIGLSCCYDGVINAATYSATLASIGSRLENERFAKDLQGYDKELFKRLVKKVTKDHSSERYRFKAVRIIAGKEGFNQPKWAKGAKISLASPILNAVLEGCDIFEILEDTTTTFVGKKLKHNTNRHITLTWSAKECIRQGKFNASWASPMFMPLVVPPKPWVSFDTGVYQDEVLSALTPLVRKATGEQRKAIARDFEKGEPQYVKSLNALQATPLKINPMALDVIKWVRDTGLRFDGFPDLVPPEKTAYPENPDDFSPEYLKQVINDRKKWIQDDREATTNLVVLKEDVSVMEHLAGFNKFWLGWSFDFRGRMYPCSHFNYHRDDHIKSSFLFANGKKLDETSKGWLMIQLANVGDFNKISKQSLEDRIQWVIDNEEMILACAKDYKATFEKWRHADKPFQFLMAAAAYSDMLEQGVDYVCYLPISLDGTNSGTQHYALATRNKHDAAMVNLLPSSECQDVYQIVADAVVSKLQTEDDQMAKAWLDWGVNRKTVKRNTMCFGYNSLQRGMGDQIIEDLMQPLQKEVNYNSLANHPFGDTNSQAAHARYLAKINYEVISNTLESVSSGMVFLQSYADALAREGKSTRWTGPSGFPAVARYTKSTTKRSRIFLYDRAAKVRRQTRVNYQEDSFTFDTRKSRSSVAANFVHSLDSGHMQLSILYGLESGIKDYFLIHDSFGTLGADTWIFYHSIRASLADMYDHTCVFAEFEKECRNRLADPNKELAHVPLKGDLDPASVLNSEYCFS